MVCGFVFAPGTARHVTASEALEWLARRASATGGDFLWLHFNLTTPPPRSGSRDHLALPESFREALHDGSHSTRIERGRKADRGRQRRALRFLVRRVRTRRCGCSVDPRIVVTARRQAAALDRPPARRGEHGAAVPLVGRVAGPAAARPGDVLVQIVREATAASTASRTTCWSTGSRHERESTWARCAGCSCACSACSRPEPAALFRLLNHPPEWIADADLQRCANRPRSSRWCCATWRRCRSASSCCRKRSPRRSTNRTTEPLPADGRHGAGACRSTSSPACSA